MIELAKYVLPKMSFDESLFLKEMKKFYEWTRNEYPDELKTWCMHNFREKFGEKIILIFN